MSDSDDYRMRAAEFSRLAKEAESKDKREKYLRMEQSYQLLAKNADWIDATGTFLREMRAKTSRLPIGRDRRFARPPARTSGG
jgi:hypothetical protein